MNNRAELKKWLNKSIDINVPYPYGITSNEFMTSGVCEYELYNSYYSGQNDIDIEMNDKITIEYVKHMLKTDVEECKKNREIQEILQSLEIYKKDNKVIKDILIPNNTKRAHANILYKRMIDCAKDGNLLIETPEIDNNNTGMSFYYQAIFDKTMKDKFYEFCMQNSLKK